MFGDVATLNFHVDQSKGEGSFDIVLQNQHEGWNSWNKNKPIKSKIPVIARTRNETFHQNISSFDWRYHKPQLIQIETSKYRSLVTIS